MATTAKVRSNSTLSGLETIRMQMSQDIDNILPFIKKDY